MDAPVRDALLNVLNFQEDVRYILQREGITRAELARNLGEPRSSISHWLNRGRSPQSLLTFQTIYLWSTRLRQLEEKR